MDMAITIRKVNRWEQADQLGLTEGIVLISVNDDLVTRNEEFFAAVTTVKEGGATHYTLNFLSKGGRKKSVEVEVSKPLGVELYEAEGDALDKVKASTVIVTTANKVFQREIDRELGIVSAEVAYGMNLFKDLFKEVRDMVGGRSKAVETTLKDAKEQAIQDLKVEAHRIGADAVIAVDFEMSSIGDSKMIVVTAYGTAVSLQD